MQISSTLEIWISIFFIALSCSIIAFVVFTGILLLQFKKNLKAVELFVTREISPTVSEIRSAISRINNIIGNIDGGISKISDSITEIKGIINKIIGESKKVVGVFNKPWIRFIVSGILKGLEFIKKRRGGDKK